MINALNLLWIVPLSMMVGAALVICISVVAVASFSEQEIEELKALSRRMEESKNEYVEFN